MEWVVSWAELGVAPGAAIAWHVGSTNANPGSAGLGAQIDDNLGGCGEQCTGSNQFAGVVGTPISGGTGETVYSAHMFTNVRGRGRAVRAERMRPVGRRLLFLRRGLCPADER